MFIESILHSLSEEITQIPILSECLLAMIITLRFTFFHNCQEFESRHLLVWISQESFHIYKEPRSTFFFPYKGCCISDRYNGPLPKYTLRNSQEFFNTNVEHTNYCDSCWIELWKGNVHFFRIHPKDFVGEAINVIFAIDHVHCCCT